MHLIVQYDDRPLDQYAPLIENNKVYASKHNIQYLFLTAGYSEYPPWWRKVALVHEMLPHYESVLWIDSDATIVGQDHYSSLFNDRHFMFSPNPPMLTHLEMFSAPMCAGVWAVRNTPEGRSIMSHWLSCYCRDNWHYDNNVWTTSGAYAGVNYEQGAFELSIYRVADFQPWLQWYPWDVLNYLPKDDHNLRGTSCPRAFALHYWSGNRNHISKHWSTPATTTIPRPPQTDTRTTTQNTRPE